MLCPECRATNSPEATACIHCGLLLAGARPQRRAEDLAVRKRRASDQESVSCRFCSGPVAANAIRCRHCSEILDPDFYRERSQRIRSRVNYASWVLYLLGLASLLVFRPVGVIAIATGLLLSIIYYAIPVDPPSSPRGPKRSLGTFLSRQLKLERVSVPIPALGRLRLVFVGTPMIAALIGYGANVILLQQPVDAILSRSDAFRGMKVSAHYEYWVVPGVVVYDLKDLTFRQSPIDIHTAFLEFASQLRDRKLKRVELSFRGEKRFTIDGSAFANLGSEYAARNLDYVLYTFPRLFRPVGDVQPIDPEMTDREALMEFHRRWYGEEAVTGSAEH